MNLTIPPITFAAQNGKPGIREYTWSDLTLTIAEPLNSMETILSRALGIYPPPVSTLVQHLETYRGKRLRPALLFLVAQACGGIQPAHATLAAVVEMIHTATLVHDDVLDDAKIRRHSRTVHMAWGNKSSILLGDLLFTNAFHLASTIDAQACQLIGEATNRVCAGEIRQTCQRGDLNLSMDEYFAIIDGKTAALIECASRSGAIYANAAARTCDRMASFGRNLGLAFQIADDLLDLVGDERNTGKTLGTDLDERKLTLPVIHCLSMLPESSANELREQIHVHGAQARTAVLAAAQRTGSLTHAKRRAEECIQQARQDLDFLPPSKARTILDQMAQWSAHRPM